MGDIEANMATVPRRTGDGWPVRRPVAMPVPGFGGSGPYCDHAPSYHRYVDTVLVGAVLAGFWESVLLGPASWRRPPRSFLGEGFRDWVAFWESALGIAGRGKAALCFVCLKARMA